MDGVLSDSGPSHWADISMTVEVVVTLPSCVVCFVGLKTFDLNAGKTHLYSAGLAPMRVPPALVGQISIGRSHGVVNAAGCLARLHGMPF